MLTYASYGEGDGTRVVYCHGAPGSRLEGAIGQVLASQPPCQVVVPDRPGYGGSDPAPSISVRSLAYDLRDLVDSLGWDRFAILGACGGAQAALALASVCGDRVTRVGICGGMAPPLDPETNALLSDGNRALFALAAQDPAQLAEIARSLTGDAEVLAARINADVADVDRELLNCPDVSTIYLDNLREAVRQGEAGVVADFCRLAGDWDIDWSDIKAEALFWYGDQDRIADPAMGRYFRDRLTRHVFNIVPGEGHYFGFRQWGRLLNRLLD